MLRERGSLANLAAPTSAGTYYLLGSDGELLYVGKATSLRARLRQHAAGSDHPRLNRLYDLTRDVRWEEAPDVSAAAAREADVIVALQPPFNASIRDEGRWRYLAVSREPDGMTRFRLSTEPTRRAGGHLYGCFPHLGKGVSSAPGIACSDGYTALLRLLWATTATTAVMPARITRSAPDDFAVQLDPQIDAALHRLLSGTSDRLLRELEDRAESDLKMLSPALLRDRGLAFGFYERGPRALRQLRRRHGHKGLVSRPDFEALIAADLRASIGPFTGPPSPG